MPPIATESSGYATHPPGPGGRRATDPTRTRCRLPDSSVAFAVHHGQMERRAGDVRPVEVITDRSDAVVYIAGRMLLVATAVVAVIVIGLDVSWDWLRSLPSGSRPKSSAPLSSGVWCAGIAIACQSGSGHDTAGSSDNST